MAGIKTFVYSTSTNGLGLNLQYENSTLTSFVALLGAKKKDLVYTKAYPFK